jgi:diaminohydroxyphosphoribosylaminopyrimidine deaminase/5-amino-6-(5-phosphoribosylamino)uracil reductase
MVLGKRGITGVLVEGGGETLGSFVEQKLFDKVAFFYAPKLLGGRNAKTAIEGQGFQSVAEAIELREVNIKKIGGDWLVTGYPATDLSNEPD